MILHTLNFLIKMFRKRPIRMSLMLLEIAVGIAAISLVIATIYTVSHTSTDINNVILEVTPQKGYYSNNLFTEKSVSDFLLGKNYVKSLSIVERNDSGVINYNEQEYSYNGLFGVGLDFEDIIPMTLYDGTYFSSADIKNQNKVLVISKEASEAIFGKEDPLGEKLDVTFYNAQDTYTIIGVFTMGNLPKKDLAVHYLIPYTNLPGHRVFPYKSIWVTCSEKELSQTEYELEQLFNDTEDYSNKKNILNFNKQFEQTKKDQVYFMNKFTTFFSFCAILALVVGSLGIFSMLLTSVLERTHEIGIRRSFGATKLNVITQILSEAIIISLAGGLFGLIISFVAAQPIMNNIILKGFTELFTEITVALPYQFIPLILLGASVIGIISGLYPALVASTMTIQENIRNKV